MNQTTSTASAAEAAGAGSRPLLRHAPLYQQVTDHLIAAIRCGDYTPGQLLPSEAQLSAYFGISRPTVRQAIAGLRERGLVIVRNGKGAFVASDDEAQPCPACGSPRAQDPGGVRRVWYFTDDDEQASASVFPDLATAKAQAVYDLVNTDVAEYDRNLLTWREHQYPSGATAWLLDHQGTYTGWSVSSIPLAAPIQPTQSGA